MLFRLKAFYHLRRPRIPSETDLAFRRYTSSMKRARREVHLQAVSYQQQIEDAYLEQHKKTTKQKHFDNECAFRKRVFVDSYRLYQDQIKWNKEDERFSSALNKHLHDQDIKKINRSRIMKIMEHESTNYWFNSQNVQTRLKDQTIFPQYIASSEYYYKLFAEAMAYEVADFQELHKISSSEQTLKQKNKYLIPLFLKLRNKIQNFKRNQKSNQIDKVKLLKNKIKGLLSIFNTWKEYTNILGMTSSQIIKSKEDLQGQYQIQKTQKQVLKAMKIKKEDTFIDSIEEDTQDLEIGFEQYLSKINQQRKQNQLSPNQSASMQDFNRLMSSSSTQEPINPADQLNINPNKGPDLSELTNKPSSQMKEVDEEEVDLNFLNMKETTASVEVLKKQYEQDEQMLKLLNQLGQIQVSYPKLFQTIWKSCQV